MATERQLEAARKNGRQSRGPKTPEGKARSSMNSIKHRFFSSALRFDNDEDKNAYTTFRRDLAKHYAANDPLARVLVDKLAVLMWNQRKMLPAMGERIEDCRTGRLASRVAKFVQDTGLIDQPVPTRQRDASASALECREILLKTVKSHGESKTEAENKLGNEKKSLDASGDATQDRTEFEARLVPAMDSVLRAYTTIERSIERTITLLLRLQGEDD
jgi:hypothetical protein